MEKHVCYDKLQKKKQREIDQRKRDSWLGVNPVTRKPESSKTYNRRKAQDWKKDSGLALFHLFYQRETPALWPGFCG